MKLPEPIEHLLHPKEKARGEEIFLSLLLSSRGVAACGWYVDAAKNIQVTTYSFQPVPKDSWEDRTAAADRVVAAVEEKLSETTRLDKVVLGLPGEYLTDTGDITESTKPHIKRLTSALDLTPIGFVSLHQALVYKLKKDEGVPPSVIVLWEGTTTCTVYVYKVGTLVGKSSFEKGEEMVLGAQKALNSFHDVEVLPSRVLITGTDEAALQELRAALLRHPWPTKANFLHFPKIETVAVESVLTAVSLAGASELATSMEEVAVSPPPSMPEEAKEKEEVAYTVEEISQKEASEPPTVELVEPETFGFQKRDVLEAQSLPERDAQQAEQAVQEPQPVQEARWKKFFANLKFPRLSIPRLPVRQAGLPAGKAGLPEWHFALPPITARRSGITIAIIACLFIGILGLLGWVLPKAEVTVLAIPTSVSARATITVDPTSTVVDGQTKTIPGRKQEKTVSGEKTIAVTGTKEVGDPARGTVTIYNKSLTTRTLKKGSILAASGVTFSLDSDVSVASASESIGSITFGKANGAVTAVDIGTEGNLAAGTEFIFQEVSSSVAVARNDSAFTGGTSREVTVVSRKDYDALTAQLTEELVAKAKGELATTVAGSEKLVEETIETDVAERSFAQEIDQEANQLNGKLTVVVTGVSYNEGDLTQILAEGAQGKVPAGHSLLPARTEVTVDSVQLKKDGTITMAATLGGMALPTLDGETVRVNIAGKSIHAAQEYLKSTTGVGGVEFRFLRNILLPNRLPMKSNNISITVAVQE